MQQHALLAFRHWRKLFLCGAKACHRACGRRASRGWMRGVRRCTVGIGLAEAGRLNPIRRLKGRVGIRSLWNEWEADEPVAYLAQLCVVLAGCFRKDCSLDSTKLGSVEIMRGARTTAAGERTEAAR
ncbi:hypothetical protein N656DRAFT_437010 [Canariomyces notabilis]|uniref:Uncharacterized protein n=1 Tax=Canariomyces notabilis TaxID=2074819 RepID=A0AAN6QDP5_9PEZI|nr:hypothetical protein N656DRAFT_437010 [Canariomyces arenarius]